MTDEQRAAVEQAKYERRKAEDAYRDAMDKIDPLRRKWIEADLALKALMLSLNTTAANRVFRD